MVFLPDNLLAATHSQSALWTFLGYTLVVFVLAGLANSLLKDRNFMSEYFLGSRGLGMWAFALTFAATSASGGSFTGFPAKIYMHGWVLALWISSYMVYPICTMGFLGKRINQVARKTNAITVPDILRDRFESRDFGILATALIVFFLSVNLVAQFKAGSVILQILVQDHPVFHSTSGMLGTWIADIPFFAGVKPAYLTCLLLFSVAVIAYTTWGGFHAVVWTDVMQGIVMVLGIAVMLPLTIIQIGGFKAGTEAMAEMIPPKIGKGRIVLHEPLEEPLILTDVWFSGHNEWYEGFNSGGTIRLARMAGTVVIPAGDTEVSDVTFVELQTPSEIDRQLRKLQRAEEQITPEERSASLSLPPVYQQLLKQEEWGNVVFLRNHKVPFIAILGDFQEFDYGAGETGHYVTGPGPQPPSQSELAGPSTDVGFLPLGIAISYFFMWAISGTGQPHYMVRLMAFKNADTLRKAIITVTVYYGAIYFPLVVIFAYSRILLPGMETEADKIMPTLAVVLTEGIGQGWLAGILIAAPFAAVMSTVDSVLLVVSSAVVRDIYQRNINPDATEKTVKRLSYFTTLGIGSIAMLFAINPPQFLQDLIIYVGSGLATCFLFPVVAALYWRRSNVYGCVAGMLGGFGTHLLMHLIGWQVNGAFTNPYNLWGLSPVLIGLVASLLCTLVITPLTPAPPQHLVQRYFYRTPLSTD